MNKKTLAAALVLSALTVLSACGKAQAPQTTPASDSDVSYQSPPASDTDVAPSVGLTAFTGLDLDGNQVDQSIFADYKLTMVNIWATYCGPCIQEMPDLGKLSAELADSGVRIVGIVSDITGSDGAVSQSGIDSAKAIVEETGAAYLHLQPTADIVNGIFADLYAMPTTYFVDSLGNVIGEAYVGSRTAQQWTEIIEGLLADIDG